MWVDDVINELLKDCEVLITSGSSAIFEAIFAGIKTLYVIPEGFSLGSERFIKNHVLVAYEKDFYARLQEIVSSPKFPDVDINEYFSPPNYNQFEECLKCS